MTFNGVIILMLSFR